MSRVGENSPISIRAIGHVPELKRFRSRNFSSSEKSLLQHLLNSYGVGSRLVQSSMDSHLTDMTGCAGKNRRKFRHLEKIKWQEVASKFNKLMVGSPQRSPRQLRSLWSGMLRTARRAARNHSKTPTLSRPVAEASVTPVEEDTEDAQPTGNTDEAQKSELKEPCTPIMPGATTPIEPHGDNTRDTSSIDTTNATETDSQDAEKASYEDISKDSNVNNATDDNNNQCYVWNTPNPHWMELNNQTYAGYDRGIGGQTLSYNSANLVDADCSLTSLNTLTALTPVTIMKSMSPGPRETLPLLVHSTDRETPTTSQCSPRAESALDLRHPGRMQESTSHIQSDGHIPTSRMQRSKRLCGRTDRQTFDLVQPAGQTVSSVDAQEELLIMARVEHSACMELLQVLAQQAQEQHTAQMALLERRTAMLAQCPQYSHQTASTGHDDAVMAEWQNSASW